MAENMVISCPKCAKKFKGNSDLAGKKIKCPFCKQPFVVPQGKVPVKAEGGGARSAAPPPPAAPPKPRAPVDEDEGPHRYEVTTPDLAARCPFCAKELTSANAVICVHCGYNTQTREIGKTIQTFAVTGKEHFMYLLPGFIMLAVMLLLIIFLMWFCLVFPFHCKDTWFAWANHESMRLWSTLITLSYVWPAGFFCFNRLVIKPKPEEKQKD
jgi:DNA-directed RNA polymerase subunit RPC12/RpoP